MPHRRSPLSAGLGVLLALALLAGCRPAAPATPQPTITARPAPSATPAAAPGPGLPPPEGLSEQEMATLGSLQQVDDYPLYSMQYVGAYAERVEALPSGAAARPGWGCALFTTLYDPQNRLYGRNFDWEFSPALLLFSDPPDGYASAAMVDIAYLGFGGQAGRDLTSLPLEELLPLLQAPYLPFDGMNEAGLAVGMAAVADEAQPYDPARETIGSLGVMRELLDHAATVAEAVALLGSYNIDFSGGPMLHYLVADASGQAALVEFRQGEMFVLPNQAPWHLATNFLVSSSGDDASGHCWRYDALQQNLAQANGRLAMGQALGLLASVAQPGTQWSVVYNLSSAELSVVMGQQYQVVHAFHLTPGE